MRLFLVRHGETVDNVAGLYAGSRDSPLTSHGVLQAKRLGDHLESRASSIGSIRNIYSSDLQRALHTAQRIVDAQSRQSEMAVVTSPDLRERDFRSSEGKSFTSKRKIDQVSSVRDDAETYQEMRDRIARFIDDHLSPALRRLSGDDDSSAKSIVVVAHGIILNVLVSSLISRYGTVELQASTGGTRGADITTVWSNTGYTELEVQLGEINVSGTSATAKPSPAVQAAVRIELKVIAVNVTDHLTGLKKTRGGIGSASFDRKQKTMDSFFGPPTKRKKPDGPSGT